MKASSKANEQYGDLRNKKLDSSIILTGLFTSMYGSGIDNTAVTETSKGDYTEVKDSSIQ